MPSRSIFWVGVLALGGCARTYHWAYEYQPRPTAVSVTTPPATEAAPVHVLATVAGVRAEGAEEHPATVEVRMRLENQTPLPAALVPQSLELRSADLRAFGPPAVVPHDALTVPPGQASEFTAYFPFASGDVPGGHDLDGLSLRWTLELGDQGLTRTATFTRREPARHYYDHGPWFGVQYHFLHVHHRHRRR